MASFSYDMFLYAEILRVSGMMSNQGFGDFDRMRHRSPSPMASSNLMSNVTGTGLGGWNGLPQEVIVFLIFRETSLIFESPALHFVYYFIDCLCKR